MSELILGKSVDVISPTNLYKWAKTWGKVQKNYYPYPVYLRREKQIEDFVALNEFKNLYIKRDTDILKDLRTVDTPANADLMIIADQAFARLPCTAIIEQVDQLLTQCPNMILCLNRHYINIDNSYHDSLLSEHYPLAITQWLKQNLSSAKILDLSLDYLDCGDWFTWVVPDRIYYIQHATG